MADRRSNQRAPRHAAVASPATATAANDSFAGAFLQKLHEHVPDSSQLLGFLTLFISSGILLLLTGLTVTLSVTGLVFLAPLIILTSPLWVPVAALVLLAAASLVSVGGFGFVAMAGFSWLYKYFRGFHPPGSERADYARDRIYDTARQVKDYAREYGGYLQGKLKAWPLVHDLMRIVMVLKYEVAFDIFKTCFKDEMVFPGNGIVISGVVVSGEFVSPTISIPTAFYLHY